MVTLARKPMGSTAAGCAVEHGTGSLNIGAVRIGSDLITVGHNVGDSFSQSYQAKGTTPERSHYTQHRGRWPSNLIFQHQRECEIVGERQVKTGVAVRENSGGKTIFSETEKPPMGNMSYGDGGKEAIPDWRCAEGCPVPDLDRQSGVTTSKGHVRNNAGSWKVRKKGNTIASVETAHMDTGGASRFYRQVKP